MLAWYRTDEFDIPLGVECAWPGQATPLPGADRPGLAERGSHAHGPSPANAEAHRAVTNPAFSCPSKHGAGAG